MELRFFFDGDWSASQTARDREATHAPSAGRGRFARRAKGVGRAPWQARHPGRAGSEDGMTGRQDAAPAIYPDGQIGQDTGLTPEENGQ